MRYCEVKLVRSDGYPVAVVQRGWSKQQALIDISTVGAPKVFNLKSLGGPANDGVLPGNSGILDGDRRLQFTTNRKTITDLGPHPRGFDQEADLIHSQMPSP